MIRRLTMTGVFAFKGEVDVHLPESGVVLVTGNNGEGKSALVEGMAFGLFGRTLRGRKPWNGEEGSIALALDPALSIHRRWAKGKNTLRWSSGATPEHESRTKAQEDLAGIVGTFDSWRASCVFSSASASSFTRATDTERKVMIETLLGLDCLAAGYAAAREAARATRLALERSDATSKAADAAVARAEAEVARIASIDASQVPELRARLVEAREVADAAAETAARVGALTDTWRQRLSVAQSAFAGATANARAALRSRRETSTVGAATLAQATSAAVRAQLAPKCALCGSTLSADTHAEHVRAADAAVEAAQKDMAAKIAAADAAVDAATAEELRTCAEVGVLVAEERAVMERDQAARRAYRDADAEVSALEAQVALLTAVGQREREAAHRVLAEAKDEAHTAARVLALNAANDARAESVVAALAPNGPRARVLASALERIAEVANEWLELVAPTRPMRVRLSVRDGAREAVLLEIEGAGGGEGYAALSVGEQRRVDVAIMLALSSAFTHNDDADLSRMPLVFDEVFDGLDAKGVEAMGVVVERLAQSRAVLVISHNPLLAEALRGVRAAWRVVDGAVWSS